MTSTICRAKNPATCQYHGSGASSNTRKLRDTMMVARSVFNAASHSEKFEAYYNLQDAETAYYGTEEGRASLIDSINSTTDAKSRTHWLEILAKADQKREFIETQMNSRNDQRNHAEPDSLVFNQNMKVEDFGGRKYVLMADGAYPDGTKYRFDWDQSSGQVAYEEEGDEESMRVLGAARDLTSAKSLCSNWFSRTSAQSISN